MLWAGPGASLEPLGTRGPFPGPLSRSFQCLLWEAFLALKLQTSVTFLVLNTPFPLPSPFDKDECTVIEPKNAAKL